jgi:hypothetical protein
MIKVYEKDGVTPFPLGVEALRKIIEKRMDSGLFDEEMRDGNNVLDTMILNSGGVLRDLFEMIEIAANSADYLRASKIGHEHAKYALGRLKADYRGMITVVNEKEYALTTDQLYEKLIAIAKSSTKKSRMDNALLLLLSCLAVVEYNSEQWFDVHPAVKSLLKDMGEI